jgi:hypothetical protein
MLTIERFFEAGRHPANVYEYRMAQAYRSALADLESAKRDSENPSTLIDAERRLGEIRCDIENFMTIVGSYSRKDINDKMHRCELDIANAKRKAHNIKKKVIRENPNLSPDEVERLEIVRASSSKRDSLITELGPIIADSKEKIQKAWEILIKYG